VLLSISQDTVEGPVPPVPGGPAHLLVVLSVTLLVLQGALDRWFLAP
jgi:hypothetical protein